MLCLIWKCIRPNISKEFIYKTLRRMVALIILIYLFTDDLKGDSRYNTLLLTYSLF